MIHQNLLWDVFQFVKIGALINQCRFVCKEWYIVSKDLIQKRYKNSIQSKMDQLYPRCTTKPKESPVNYLYIFDHKVMLHLYCSPANEEYSVFHMVLIDKHSNMWIIDGVSCIPDPTPHFAFYPKFNMVIFFSNSSMITFSFETLKIQRLGHINQGTLDGIATKSEKNPVVVSLRFDKSFPKHDDYEGKRYNQFNCRMGQIMTYPDTFGVYLMMNSWDIIEIVYYHHFLNNKDQFCPFWVIVMNHIGTETYDYVLATLDDMKVLFTDESENIEPVFFDSQKLIKFHRFDKSDPKCFQIIHTFDAPHYQ